MFCDLFDKFILIIPSYIIYGSAFCFVFNAINKKKCVKLFALEPNVFNIDIALQMTPHHMYLVHFVPESISVAVAKYFNACIFTNEIS